MRVSRDVPFDVLASLGCAVLTGVGAVTNTARVPAGATVVVIGAGGVGLNVVQGAVMAGSARVIAVDPQAAALALATTFGATDVVPAGEAAVATIRELTRGRGADFVFDTVGAPATLTDALASIKKGGTVVVTGLSRTDAQASISIFPFVMQEKTLIGSVYGSASRRATFHGWSARSERRAAEGAGGAAVSARRSERRARCPRGGDRRAA